MSESERRGLARDFEKLLRSERAPAAEADAAAAPVPPSIELTEFFAEYLVHVKGGAAGEPFVLEPWQREFLEEFDRVDELGCRIYNRGLLGVPRGNGKSPLAAGRALYDLVTKTDAPDVFTAAAAKDQARITLDYARGFAAQGPLSELLEVGRHEIRNPANGGALRALSADGYVQHGLNPSAAILDELHAFSTSKQQEVFTALDTAVHKREGAYWLATTTATGDRGSLLGLLLTEIQERFEVDRLQRGLWVARDETTGFLAYWYGADETSDFDDERLWRAVNPASFVSLDALRKQRSSPSMPKTTFARLHLNAPVLEERERWIPLPEWDRLADGTSIAEGSTAYLGLDGSRTFDTSVVAVAAPAADGRVDVSCTVFATRQDVAHHVHHAGGRINFEDIEDAAVDLFERFDVREAAYDPRYLDRSAELLESRLQATAIFSVEPSSKHMRSALAALERGVLDGTLRHDGDPVLREHLAWCIADRSDSGELRRVSKADRSRPIDAVIAVALAYWRASLTGGPSVYEERGILLV